MSRFSVGVYGFFLSSAKNDEATSSSRGSAVSAGTAYPSYRRISCLSGGTLAQ